MTDAEAVFALQTRAEVISRTGPSRLWTCSTYTLILAGILLIGRYQFAILVPHILAAATQTRWVKWLAYLGVFWVWLGFLLIRARHRCSTCSTFCAASAHCISYTAFSTPISIRLRSSGYSRMRLPRYAREAG